jgi:hypothetical protein
MRAPKTLKLPLAEELKDPNTKSFMKRHTDILDRAWRLLRDGLVTNETNITNNTTNITTIQGEQARLAYCKTDAGAGTTLVCYLDTDATGDEETVNFNISNGSALNAATPRLNDGDRIVVVKIGSSWYCTGLFNNVGAC